MNVCERSRLVSFVLVGWALGASAGLSSCTTVKQVERKESANKPEAQTEQLDYSKPFEQSRFSNSVIDDPVPPDLMERVLLSPNLVFETSRSSQKEPKTYGPSEAGTDTPHLEHALGKPIDRDLSAKLLEYLVEQGSTPIAPVVTGLWEEHCKTCSADSWVERTMHMYQSVGSVGTDEADTSADTSSQHESSDRLGRMSSEELPTSIFAVRELGLVRRSIPLRVYKEEPETKQEKSVYVVERRRPGESNICSDDFSVSLPFVTFEAELVDLTNGRILMRIDELRTLDPPKSMSTTVTTTTYDPVEKEAYGEWRVMMGERQSPVRRSSYSYTASWSENSVACENIRSELQKAADRMTRRARPTKLAAKLARETLEPLYE
jgi:hypothetical protein